MNLPYVLELSRMFVCRIIDYIVKNALFWAWDYNFNVYI